MRLDLTRAEVLDLLSAWGTPYSWGGGIPYDGAASWPGGVPGLNGGTGWDCSGFAQAALVRLHRLPESAPDRNAQGLFRIAEPLPNGERAELGDLAFYGRGPNTVDHVMVVIGDGACIGACGGGRKTNGLDPRAYVQLHPLRYRNDFLGVRRLKPAA